MTTITLEDSFINVYHNGQFQKQLKESKTLELSEIRLARQSEQSDLYNIFLKDGTEYEFYNDPHTFNFRSQFPFFPYFDHQETIREELIDLKEQVLFLCELVDTLQKELRN